MESAIKDKSSGGALPPTDKEFDLLLADGDDFVDLDLEALANIIADCPTGLSDVAGGPGACRHGLGDGFVGDPETEAYIHQ